MDCRVISASTRVFNALCPAMTSAGLRIAPRADGSHVRVAVFIVNNNPETMERSRPHAKVGSLHDAAVRRGARVPCAAQHEVVRCRPGTAAICGGPGSATHRVADARAASHPGHAITSDAFVALFTFQTAHVYSFPRRVFAPGVCNFASLTPDRGVGGAPRDVGCCAKHPWGVP